MIAGQRIIGTNTIVYYSNSPYSDVLEVYGYADDGGNVYPGTRPRRWSYNLMSAFRAPQAPTYPKRHRRIRPQPPRVVFRGGVRDASQRKWR